MTKNKEQNKWDDWRLQALTTLAKPWKSPWTGHEYPVGTQVALVSIVEYDYKRNITVPMPNATAMFLNMSHKFYIQAKEIFTSGKHIKVRGNNLDFISDTAGIDYLESICASVVFAYSALEAFANEVIPDEHTFKRERQDKKCIETYNKHQIERHLSLDVKLDKILPEIFKAKSPKGKKIWDKYIELKKLRDRIIHLKSIDRKSSRPDKETIWKYLLKKEIPYMAPVAKNLIDYYVKFMDIEKNQDG